MKLSSVVLVCLTMLSQTVLGNSLCVARSVACHSQRGVTVMWGKVGVLDSAALKLTSWALRDKMEIIYIFTQFENPILCIKPYCMGRAKGEVPFLPSSLSSPPHSLVIPEKTKRREDMRAVLRWVNWKFVLQKKDGSFHFFSEGMPQAHTTTPHIAHTPPLLTL